MNAHSKMWNPRVTRSRNHTFWEWLIEEEDLFVWNTEEAMRIGPGVMNHSVIDLTISSLNMDMSWVLLGEEATGSDHELIGWEVLIRNKPSTWGGETKEGAGSEGIYISRIPRVSATILRSFGKEPTTPPAL